MRTKEQLSAAFNSWVPRWLGTAMIGLCAFLLTRIINQIDLVSATVSKNTTDIAVHTEQIAQASKAFVQLDGVIHDWVERLIRHEAKDVLLLKNK